MKAGSVQTHLVFWGTLLALFLLLVGPALSWNYSWPPGLGIVWTAYLAITVIALAVDAFGILRCKGWTRAWMALLLVPTFLSANSLLQIYNLEQSHRLIQPRQRSPSSFLDLLEPAGSTGGRRSFNLPLPFAKAESEISEFMVKLGASTSEPPFKVDCAMRHWTWGDNALTLYSGRQFGLMNISGAMIFPATDSDPKCSTVLIYLADRWPPRTQPY